MLKHGRFMANLVVSPVYPEPLLASEEDPEEAGSQANSNEE